MYFVIQGSLIATYKLTSADRSALFLGTKSAESSADGLVKALGTFKMFEGVSRKIKAEVTALRLVPQSSEDPFARNISLQSGKDHIMNLIRNFSSESEPAKEEESETKIDI